MADRRRQTNKIGWPPNHDKAIKRESGSFCQWQLPQVQAYVYAEFLKAGQESVQPAISVGAFGLENGKALCVYLRHGRCPESTWEGKPGRPSRVKIVLKHFLKQWVGWQLPNNGRLSSKPRLSVQTETAVPDLPSACYNKWRGGVDKLLSIPGIEEAIKVVREHTWLRAEFEALMEAGEKGNLVVDGDSADEWLDKLAPGAGQKIAKLLSGQSSSIVLPTIQAWRYYTIIGEVRFNHFVTPVFAGSSKLARLPWHCTI